ALVAVVLLALAGFLTLSMLNAMKPHGDWDAWVSWNLRAKFLVQGGDLWTRAFSPLVPRACPDYPVLLPALVARCWRYVGSDVLTVPILVAGCFMFGLVGITSGALYLLRGGTQALLAAAVLLGTPFLLAHTASQYADVPMGFFFVSTVVLLSLAGRFGEARHGLFALAGLTTGLAIFTKNEGLLFLLGLVLVGGVRLVRAHDRKAHLRLLGAFLAGLAPPLMLFVYFKAAVAPGANYMTRNLGAEQILARCGDFSRYTFVTGAYLAQLFDVARWNALPLLLPFYFLLSGSGTDDRDRVAVRAGAWVLGVMLLGHFVTYLITAEDIKWHVSYSIDRTLLQLWPTAVFTFFLAVRTPREAVAGTDPQR
ncbi:MAG TPA: hypothetical protein VMY39_05975, partial [Planctomycetota bacterium]|nr:hypothetical protein [Planctomycetota bacterium]